MSATVADVEERVARELALLLARQRRMPSPERPEPAQLKESVAASIAALQGYLAAREATRARMLEDRLTTLEVAVTAARAKAAAAGLQVDDEQQAVALVLEHLAGELAALRAEHARLEEEHLECGRRAADLADDYEAFGEADAQLDAARERRDAAGARAAALEAARSCFAGMMAGAESPPPPLPMPFEAADPCVLAFVRRVAASMDAEAAAAGAAAAPAAAMRSGGAESHGASGSGAPPPSAAAAAATTPQRTASPGAPAACSTAERLRARRAVVYQDPDSSSCCGSSESDCPEAGPKPKVPRRSVPGTTPARRASDGDIAEGALLQFTCALCRHACTIRSGRQEYCRGCRTLRTAARGTVPVAQLRRWMLDGSLAQHYPVPAGFRPALGSAMPLHADGYALECEPFRAGSSGDKEGATGRKRSGLSFAILGTGLRPGDKARAAHRTDTPGPQEPPRREGDAAAAAGARAQPKSAGRPKSAGLPTGASRHGGASPSAPKARMEGRGTRVSAAAAAAAAALTPSAPCPTPPAPAAGTSAAAAQGAARPTPPAHATPASATAPSGADCSATPAPAAAAAAADADLLAEAAAYAAGGAAAVRPPRAPSPTSSSDDDGIVKHKVTGEAPRPRPRCSFCELTHDVAHFGTSQRPRSYCDPCAALIRAASSKGYNLQRLREALQEGALYEVGVRVPPGFVLPVWAAQAQRMARCSAPAPPQSAEAQAPGRDSAGGARTTERGGGGEAGAAAAGAGGAAGADVHAP